LLDGDLLRFQVIDGNGNGTVDGVPPAPVIQEPAAASVASDAPPKRKGGRPKKKTAA
jgi:hypothetical protein